VCALTDDLDRDQDLIAAETFLIGYVKEEKSGFHKRKTHKKGSTEEKFCRAALIRLLRDQERPLDPGLRDILADMFEFDTAGCLETDFKLEVCHREAHRPSDNIDAQVAKFVWTKMQREGLGADAAVVQAIERFSKSRSFVYDAWGRFKPYFQRKDIPRK